MTRNELIKLWTKITNLFARKSDLTSKQDVINDLNDIRNGAALGTTALQSYTETDPIFQASAASNITSTDISNWDGKQNALVSGINIKTINNTSLLGSGNVEVGDITSVELQEEIENLKSTLLTDVVTESNLKTVNGTSLIGTGDVEVVSTNIGDVAIMQGPGDSQTAVMSQKAIKDIINKDIKVCQCVHFGLTTVNYFNLTNEQVSALNNTNVISIRFVAQAKGDASNPWRYFVLCGTSHYSRDTTTGFYLKYDYSRRLFASGVNYNTADCINKLSNGTIINPAVHTIVWNKATGTIKFYERNNLVSTQQNDTWKLTNFINTTVNCITLYSGDNDILLYDLQVYDGDISELFTYAQGNVKKEEMVTAGASYINTFYDGNLQTYHGQQVNSNVGDYGNGSGFTVVTASNSPDGYKHVKSTSSATTSSYSACGYYVGTTDKAEYWESDVEVVSGEVIFTKHSSNVAPITIIDSNNNELPDGSTVGIGEYTLKGVGAVVGKWKLTYVSGVVDVIHKANRVKYISCVVHIKGNVVIGKSLYDEQADTYYTINNIAPDGTPFDQVVLNTDRPPVFVGQRAMSGTNIYIGNSNYTWIKVN